MEEMLAKWELTALAEAGSLVVSELATNAIQAMGELSAESQAHYSEKPLSVSYRELATLGCVRLRLSYDRIRLLIEVWDTSEEPPAARVSELEAEGGRGLLLVTALCMNWGWYPSRSGGKVVWAELERKS